MANGDDLRLQRICCADQRVYSNRPVGNMPVVFHIFLLAVVGYTIVTAIGSSIVVYIFPILFKRFFDEKQWTKGKYFIFAFAIILTIAVANALYAYYFIRIIFYPEIDDISFSMVLNHFLITTPIIGIIPTILGYFWLKNRALYVDLHEKEDQNRKLIFRIQENASDEKNHYLIRQYQRFADIVSAGIAVYRIGGQLCTCSLSNEWANIRKNVSGYLAANGRTFERLSVFCPLPPCIHY